MESWGWHVTLLQIMLLLVLLALPAVADCQWDDLTNDALHYGPHFTASGYKATVKDGEKAPYKCQDGYFPSGHYSGPRVLNATCRGDKWEWDPTYQLSCRPVSCGHPCPNGVCKNGAVTPLVFNFPSVVTFTCIKGYHLVTHDDQYWDPSTIVSCEVDGTWSYPAPKCVEIICPQPVPIADGQVNPTQGTFRENNTIQYTCNQGFTMVGNATLRCQNDGRWSGKEPICELQCSAPPPLPHGEIKTNNMWEVGAVIIYACFDGQRQSATCGKDLKWHPDPPTCKDTSKPPATTCAAPPAVPNGAVDLPQGTLDVNTRVQYRCNAGFTLVGAAERVCQNDGSWSGAEPVCEAAPATATCPAPGTIANGAVDVPPGTIVVNTRAQYRCDAGYTLVGMMERVCQADGSWSDAEPVCQVAGQSPKTPQPPTPPQTPQGPLPGPHSPPPAGDDKTSPPDGSSEAQMTSWVLLALIGVLVVAGAVVLYMAFQFYRKQRRARASITSSTRTE